MADENKPKRKGGGRSKVTHCPNGHPLSGENLVIDTRGTRYCKICRRTRESSPEAKERDKAHYRKNRDRILEKAKIYSLKNRELLRQKAADRRSRIRAAVLSLLGNRCANPNCRHLNQDGTLGCKDERLLQIDHIHGNGTKERKRLGNNPYAVFIKVLRDQGKGYRLLCAQCNWLHRIEDF